MLTNGSIHPIPVAIMATPARTTPTDTAASAAMCKNAPRTFASSLLPCIKRIAVAVFITTPITATAIMVNPATGAGSLSRQTASHKITAQAASRSIAFKKAAYMVARRSPKVNFLLGGRRARKLAPHASNNPTTSPALWPASARRANDPLTKPKPNSTKTKSRLRLTPIIIARSRLFGVIA